MAESHRTHILTLLILLTWLCLPGVATARTIIGLIIPRGTPNFQEAQKVLQETIKAEVPTSEIEIILQRPFPDAIALGNATRKLVAAGAEMLVTYGTNATLAALNEKTNLPLIYSGVYDPETAPFTGSDLTGCGYKIPLTSLLRYLRELKTINTVCVIYCSQESDTVRQLNELMAIAKAQQITLIPINIKNSEEIDKGQLSRGDALLITGGNVVNLRLPDILEKAHANQQPSIGLLPDSDEAGVTISLYNSPQDQSKKTAQMAARILAGGHARDIKPETMRSTELVFNLREAKRIGVKIPFQMVAEASKVIK